jgi:hypothetical protein
LVEVQRQKSATAELLKLNRTLESRVAEIDVGVSRSGRYAESNARLERELQSTRERLSRLEEAPKSSVPSETTDPVHRGGGGGSARTPQKSADWNW